MKAVAVSAEYFDDCQSSSPRQGPGANSFSLLMREIQSVLFYTSIFNIINFQVFVNTEFMMDTGNTEFMMDAGAVGQTIKIQESRRPGDSSPGCRRTPSDYTLESPLDTAT